MSKLILSLTHFIFTVGWQVKLLIARITKRQLSGVQVVVLFKSKILLIQNTYRSGYYLPGGGIQLNENYLSAAIRELKEETGLSVIVEDLALIGTFKYVISGVSVSDTIYQVTLQDEEKLSIDPYEIATADFVESSAALLLDCQSHIKEIIRTLRLSTRR